VKRLLLKSAAVATLAIVSTAAGAKRLEKTSTNNDQDKQGNEMNKPKFFVTPGYGENLRNALHYSQAVRIGDRVETSGQGGWDENFKFPKSIEGEIRQAFRNLEKTLAIAGASWQHVVHVNSYHVGGFPPEVNDTMVKLYRKYMPNHAPIWTQLGVEALGLPAMRIEIRVTAIVT
jgi:enamine deaminase RidA (YjgF/YER057c/UK114 family)